MGAQADKIHEWLERHREGVGLQLAAAQSLPRLGALWVYGAGRFGQQLASALQARGLAIAGFIDQRAQGPVQGWRVLRPDEPGWHGQTVLLGVHNPGADTQAILVILEGLAQRTLTPPQWIALCPEMSHFWLAPAQAHVPTFDDLARATEALQDQASWQAWDELLSWRWLGRPMGPSAAWPDPYQPADVPYFQSPCRMIDAGAYTGDTWAEFRPRLEAYLGLEPDPHNHRELLGALAGDTSGRSLALPVAAWDKQEVLRFASDDAAGHVAADGLRVQAMRLDDWQAWSPTLIKMDIEGAEPQALAGARQHIQAGAALAISAYHHPAHLWQLPALIRELAGPGLSGRQAWLRCHSHNGFDAVYYVGQGAQA